MNKPTTKMARRQRIKVNVPKQNPKPDPKDLKNTEVKRRFVQAVTSELAKKQGLKGTDEVGSNLVKCLETAAQETLRESLLKGFDEKFR